MVQMLVLSCHESFQEKVQHFFLPKMIKLVWFCLSVFDEFLFSNRLRFFVKKQHSQPRARKPGRGEKQNDTLLVWDAALQLGNGIMLDYRPLIFRSFSSEKFIKISRWILLLFPARSNHTSVA